VPVAWRGRAECPLQKNLPWRGGEQVRTPYHLVHTLRGIVDDGRQVIGDLAVSPPDGEITRFPPAVLTIAALIGVIECHDRLVGGDCEAQGVWTLGRRRVSTAGPGIDWFSAWFRGLGDRELRAAAPARIRLS